MLMTEEQASQSQGRDKRIEQLKILKLRLEEIEKAMTGNIEKESNQEFEKLLSEINELCKDEADAQSS